MPHNLGHNIGSLQAYFIYLSNSNIIFDLGTLIPMEFPRHQWPLFSETIHTKFWLMLWEKIQVHGLKMYLFLIVIIFFSFFFTKHIFFARSNFLFDFLIHNIYIFRTVFKRFCIHSTRYILSIDRSSYSANWHISFCLTPLHYDSIALQYVNTKSNFDLQKVINKKL